MALEDYAEYLENETFMDILDYIRGNCIATEDEVADGLDIPKSEVMPYYRIAQAMVSEELDRGISHDPEGESVARGFMDALTGGRFNK